jgi:GTPase SAR1 family protein
MTAEEKTALKLSRQLEAENAKYFSTQQDKIRLLLLGAGESGKSTIFKQMRILYGAGFSEEDRHHYVSSIHHNTISCMKVICEQAHEFGFEDQVLAKSEFKAIFELNEHNPVSESVGTILKALWADPGVQMAWAKRNEYQVIESNAEYFNKLDSISAFGYIPPDEDILISRVRTTGIVEESYIIDNVTFVIIDVGGQRNERKKWIHCFEDVNAIIYVAALSEYDQNLFEDASCNRMVEALTLFGEMCNSKWFEKTDMILYLNKRDLFEEKIQKVGIASIKEFSEYEGPANDYEAGVKYFLDEFLKRNAVTKEIFVHVTCATDSNNVRVVFDACKEIIVKQNLLLFLGP